MRFVTLKQSSQLRPGLIHGLHVHLLPEGQLVDWLDDLSGAAKIAEAGEKVLFSEAKLAAPIPRPGKILAIGLNYAAHAAESSSFHGMKNSTVQKWFNKQVTATNGPYDPVDLPYVSDQLDYEAELAVIIGHGGRHIRESEAMEHIAGYACGCDFSVRDWQRASPTMIMGKGFDTHAPFGPALVTPEEVGDVTQLGVRGYVNGELRQSATVSDMTFSIPEQIAHLSKAFTLEPGDVLFTGTPAGVGAGFDPPKWLRAGDRVRVEVDKVGAIENEVALEPAPDA